MAAKALRNIEKLAGKSYKAGDTIPDAVVSQITPQVLRSLVENHTLEVPGMDSSKASPGGQAHLMARLDKQGDQIKNLEAANATLEKRLAALEGPAGKSRKAARDAAPTG